MPQAILALAAGFSMTSGALAASYPPAPGTDRASPEYLDAVEAYLENMDLDDATLVFERLGGTTATNWSVRNGDVLVGDLKCTSGNTNHHGAVIAYRLGRELGFNIYPVAVYKQVNRTINGKKVNEQCALKEWTTVFTQYYWTRDTFADTDSADKRSLIGALDCRNAMPSSTAGFRYEANSAYGNPGIPGVKRVPYRGETTLLAAAADFSNMMVIDALIGNEDRFPGGNVFFRSETTSYEQVDGTIRFADARLFSLDNEAAFKSRGPESTHSTADLKARVSRFDSEMMARLTELMKDTDRLSGLTDDDERLIDFLRGGIQIVEDHYARSVEECGQEAATF